MSQYTRDQWGPEQGFLSGQVHAIAQTPDGYLWIGSETGLFRFDGLKFQRIQDETGIFSIRNVLGLTADRAGNLWIRLETPSLIRYHQGVFDSPMATLKWKSSRITATVATRDGELLASQMQQGATLYANGGFAMVAKGVNLPRSPVLSIAQTMDGAIWMGTRDAGLLHFSGGENYDIVEGLPDPKVNCLLPEGQRELWIGTDRGVVRWDGTKFTDSGIPAKLNHFQALAIIKDRDANIWIGTDSEGLLRLNAQGVSALHGMDHQSADIATAVFEDREGDIWTGSAKGIERLRDSAFVTYSASEGMPSAMNGPIYSDGQRTWFAPVTRGLYWMRDGDIHPFSAGGLEKDEIYSIAGRGDELWVGRQRGGLTHIQFRGRVPQVETFTRRDGLAEDSVYAVHESLDGTVWAGTISAGVSKFQNGRFVNYTNANGLASNTVYSIAESPDHTIWFATLNGLSSFSNNHWTSYGVRDGLPSPKLNCLLEDSAGVLWIGTTEGLASFRSGRIRRLVETAELLNDQILGIAEDHQGFLWIATSNHVLRVARAKLLSGFVAKEDVRDYGGRDGLRSTELVKRHRSMLTDSQGKVWMALHSGLSVVDPSRMPGSPAPVIAQIQSISADGAALDLHGSELHGDLHGDPHGDIRVPAGRQRITFGFAGLGLSVPERVRFRYALDGYDSNWSDAVSDREVTFTNLSPGSYRFRVIASNAGAAWNSPGAAIAFEIEPAFWQTTWFKLVGVFAGVMLIVAGYRVRVHQMTKELNMRFEERLAERSRIAQELHDTLLQGLLSASMQLHVAAESLPPTSPSKTRVERVLSLMGQVVEEGRNAVRGLRSSPVESLELEQAFSRVQQEIGSREPVEFRVIVDGQPRPLHPLLRDESYRIGREALVNAFRHSRATSIEAEVEYSTKQLRILVTDNGCGIDPHMMQSGLDGHWGIRGMRERAERIGAKLHVRSSSSAGTEVELSVPAHIAFVNHRAASSWRQRLRFNARKNGKPTPPQVGLSNG